MEQAGTATTMNGNITVSDVSGQRRFKVGVMPKDSTIGDLVQSLLGKMGLNRNDSEGRPLSYRARLQREGRHLDAREFVRDALQPNDELSLQPNVEAG